MTVSFYPHVLPAQVTLAGNPVLRQRCEEVDLATTSLEALAHFSETLRATLHASHGVGIAANQVDVNKRILGIEDRALLPAGSPSDAFKERDRSPVDWYFLINPSFEPLPDAGIARWFEGCLSVPGYTAVVPRYKAIRITATNSAGELHEQVIEGWHARILQHEIDHLNGHLYLDRMIIGTHMHKSEFQERWKHQPVDAVLAQLSVA